LSLVTPLIRKVLNPVPNSILILGNFSKLKRG
jgi:hypothetical protein